MKLHSVCFCKFRSSRIAVQRPRAFLSVLGQSEGLDRLQATISYAREGKENVRSMNAFDEIASNKPIYLQAHCGARLHL